MVNEKFTLADMVKTQEKIYGPGSIFTGSHLLKSRRIPFGVFAVDYISGGGLPIHGSTCIWGKKSGGKSTLAISAMKSCVALCFRCFNYKLVCTCSRKSLSQKPFWCDVEGTLDKQWAESIGVPTDEFYCALGDSGEQCINMVEKALKADDCGLVILDSLGSLIPEAEFEAPMDDKFYAIQAQLISRGVRKIKQRLIRERKREHPCAMLFANQARANLGGMKYAPKEKQPGGYGMEHEFSLLLRTTKKSLNAVNDAKYFSADKLPLAARFSVYVEKYKIDVIGGISEYIRADKHIGDLGIKKGQVDEYNTVLAEAKKIGIIQKNSKGWLYFKNQAKKQQDIITMWKKKPDEYIKTQRTIIDKKKSELANGES